MKQIDLTQWCDFVRGLADEATTEQMQEALLNGSEPAHRAFDMLRRVSEVIETDHTQPVPENAVRLAKAIGSLQRPMAAQEKVEHAISKLLNFLDFEVTFDSLLEPVTAGTRSLQTHDRQVSFEAAGLLIDLRIERDNDATAVVGHVLQTDTDTGQDDLLPVTSMSVVSLHQGRIVHNTATGEFGEFQTEGLPNHNLKLCFLVDDEECIEFPISP